MFRLSYNIILNKENLLIKDQDGQEITDCYLNIIVKQNAKQQNIVKIQLLNQEFVIKFIKTEECNKCLKLINTQKNKLKKLTKKKKLRNRNKGYWLWNVSEETGKGKVYGGSQIKMYSDKIEHLDYKDESFEYNFENVRMKKKKNTKTVQLTINKGNRKIYFTFMNLYHLTNFINFFDQQKENGSKKKEEAKEAKYEFFETFPIHIIPPKQNAKKMHSVIILQNGIIKFEDYLGQHIKENISLAKFQIRNDSLPIGKLILPINPKRKRKKKKTYKIEFERVQNMMKFSSYFGIQEIDKAENDSNFASTNNIHSNDNSINSSDSSNNNIIINNNSNNNNNNTIKFQNDFRTQIKIINEKNETISLGEISFIRFNCCIQTKSKTYRSQVSNIRHFKHKSRETMSLIQISGKKLLIIFETSLQREKFSEYFIYLNKQYEESSSRTIKFTIIYFDTSIMKKTGKGTLHMKGKYAIFRSKGQKSVKVSIENVKISVNSQQNETVTMFIDNGDKRINFVMAQIQDVEVLTQFIPLKEPVTSTQYFGMIINSKLKKFNQGMNVRIDFENEFVTFSLFELKKVIAKKIKIIKIFTARRDPNNSKAVKFNLNKKNSLGIELVSTLYAQSIVHLVDKIKENLGQKKK
ncbi:hypothetical protein M0813_01355 [Anaeramoeba flamelloides]|uniref:Uncharacterized protein n=1 Tax=Anaeramoeba flamelloides TaxID=1746091 RepID=A0ABQ8Z8U1_9EUKA|nr:hypothetical protein M0813_01355 [Anaeramoeba flamelloides]